MADDKGLRERVTRQGEETIGRLAQELLENPMVSGALTRVFETRERACERRRSRWARSTCPRRATWSG